MSYTPTQADVGTGLVLVLVIAAFISSWRSKEPGADAPDEDEDDRP